MTKAEATTDEALLEAARRAARAAATLHREEAGRVDPAEWAEKGAADFVTEVDLEAERRIVAILLETFPDHQVMAEEGTVEERGIGGSGNVSAGDAPEEGSAGEAADDPPIRWIIDPLDGTTNWLHGYPEYAVSIAGMDARGLRVGLVRNSATGEEFTAVRGGGSRRNGEPIAVSEVSELRLALLGTGFPFKRTDFLPAYLGMLDRAIRRTAGVRRAGSAALDLCDLACGRLDAFWELWLLPWDVAAGALIAWEAGGWFGPFDLGPAAEGTGDRPPELGKAADAAEVFLGCCRGGGGLPPRAGGAYLGANAALLEPLRGLLAGP